MTKTRDPVSEKCLVVKKGHTRCLVIDEGLADMPSYRLPKIDEVFNEVINKYSLVPLGSNISLLLTEEEISPWDLLDPFPPQHYYDYGYMELDTKKRDKCWKLLSEEDKELVTNSQNPLKPLIAK